MHAVLVHAQIKPGRYDEAMQALRANVVPQAKGTPGLVRATWFGDDDTGLALAVFDSEEQARQMAAMVSAGADEPVAIQDVKVYEVQAEA